MPNIGRRAHSAAVFPAFSNIVVSLITNTTARINWDVSIAATGQVEYGTTTSYGSVSTLENEDLTSHQQDLSGLTSGVTYHFRVKGQDAAGHLSYSGDLTFATTGTITYTDVTVPGSIDATGATDVEQALSDWVHTQGNGTDNSHRKRLIFPNGAIYRVKKGIHVYSQSYVTFEGNSSGNPATRCQIKTSPNSTTPWQFTSPWMIGTRLTGGTTFFDGGVNDIRITGFYMIGINLPSPGIYNATYESQATFEVNATNIIEIDNCKAEGMGGDFVKIGDSGTHWHVHDNENVNTGRQFISIISGRWSRAVDGEGTHDNDMGNVGYYFFDVEPNQVGEDCQDIDFFDNTGSYFTINAFGGGFFACGSGDAYGTIARINVLRNTLTGSPGKTSDLRSYIGQNSHARMSEINVSDNSSTTTVSASACNSSSPGGQNGGVIQVKVVDVLTVTGNTQDVSSGPFVCALNCTSVNTTSPPNIT